MNGFTLVYYQAVKGEVPVRDYIDGLESKAQAKVLAMLTLLESHGFLPFPYSSQVVGAQKLRELRVSMGRTAHRILYYLATGREIVLLHAFTKRTPEIPNEDIQIAEQRATDYAKRRRQR